MVEYWMGRLFVTIREGFVVIVQVGGVLYECHLCLTCLEYIPCLDALLSR